MEEMLLQNTYAFHGLLATELDQSWLSVTFVYTSKLYIRNFRTIFATLFFGRSKFIEHFSLDLQPIPVQNIVVHTI